ncbi:MULTISPECIES: GNAT family N-acetyltransferase [unclassified Streptomyces]|uniref:GNAT family N-acetyltransferase n=1 Tax=unclassified Streptomyces TaxID=2593676 RepID=UPI002E2EC761|nr:MULTISPECIES: GNAT family N-acetyltransferase [unclassified Streptomyces]WUC64517.1 acetyltransferase [Streptomyces sp. NBC_00539]
MTAPSGAPTTRQPVFTRSVEGFGTVTLTPVDPAADSALIHSWVIEERAAFWGMAEASRELVQEIYEDVDRRTTHHAFLVRRDGEPVALFQTYDCAEDRISECYEVEPGDVGIHLMLGPAHGAPEHGFSAALVGVFTAYLFTDAGARRLVGEPDVRNGKVMAFLERSGFVLGREIELPEIDLPEVYLPAKRARLAFLDAPEGR